MIWEDPYKDEDEEEQQWISVDQIENVDVLDKIAKKLVNVAKSTMNYAYSTVETLKRQGIDFEPKASIEPEGKKVKLTIILEPKAITKKKLEELEEIAEREKYIRLIKLKPRGRHVRRLNDYVE